MKITGKCFFCGLTAIPGTDTCKAHENVRIDKPPGRLGFPSAAGRT